MTRPTRPAPTRTEQAETDATAESVLAMLKRVLPPDAPFDKAAHAAWVAGLDPHGDACDCEECITPAAEARESARIAAVKAHRR